jgi:hypothetical protein
MTIRTGPISLGSRSPRKFKSGLHDGSMTALLKRTFWKGSGKDSYMEILPPWFLDAKTVQKIPTGELDAVLLIAGHFRSYCRFEIPLLIRMTSQFSSPQASPRICFQILKPSSYKISRETHRTLTQVRLTMEPCRAALLSRLVHQRGNGEDC